MNDRSYPILQSPPPLLSVVARNHPATTKRRTHGEGGSLLENPLTLSSAHTQSPTHLSARPQLPALGLVMIHQEQTNRLLPRAAAAGHSHSCSRLSSPPPLPPPLKMWTAARGCPYHLLYAKGHPWRTAG